MDGRDIRGVRTQGWKSRDLADGPELGSWGSSGGDKVGVLAEGEEWNQRHLWVQAACSAGKHNRKRKDGMLLLSWLGLVKQERK